MYQLHVQTFVSMLFRFLILKFNYFTLRHFQQHIINDLLIKVSVRIFCKKMRHFLKFSSKVEKWLCIRFICFSVCPSVQALSLTNIHRMFWKSYISFITPISLTILKMTCIRRIVHVQWRTKIFQYITANEGENFIRFQHSYFALKIMKLTNVT